MADNKYAGTMKLLVWLLFVFLIYRCFFAGFGGGKVTSFSTDVSGYKFKEVSSDLERAPLIRSVPQVEVSNSKDGLSVATDLAVYNFSVSTGSLKGLVYKNIKDDQGVSVDSVLSVLCEKERQNMSMLFLTDLDEVPVFALGGKEEFADRVEVEFVAYHQGWKIRKNFTVRKDSFLVSLKLVFVPDLTNNDRSAVLSNPRILFFAPNDKSCDVNGKTSGVASDVDFGANKVDVADERLAAWKFPYIFGAESRFFFHALVGEKGRAAVSRGYFSRAMDDVLTVVLELPQVNGESDFECSFYFGPKDVAYLSAVNPDLEKVLSFGWFSAICKFLIWLLGLLFGLVGNYGFAIFLLAFLVRIPFYPLAFWARRRAREFDLFEQKHAGALAEINRKYANDWALKTDKVSKFYASHGVSQLGKMIVAVPELVQFPIMFALYRVLMGYVVLYNAPFVFWITDLSATDPYFVMPLILGLLFLLQQQFSAIGSQDKGAFTKYFFPMVMIFVFSRFPVGLVLYLIAKFGIGLVEEFFFRLYFSGDKRVAR